MFYNYIYGRSVRYDVFAKDTNGNVYDLEIQRDSAGVYEERTRFNSALIDTCVSRAGDDLRTLPNSHVIFIMEHDITGLGLPIYYTYTILYRTKLRFDNRAYVILVNQEIQDDTPLGKLMADLAQPDPSKFNYPVLADKVHNLKETEKGENKMSKELQEIIDIEREDAVEEYKVESKVESIKIIMKKFGIPIDEAMETMEVPEHEYAKYRELVLNPSGMA